MAKILKYSWHSRLRRKERQRRCHKEGRSVACLKFNVTYGRRDQLLELTMHSGPLSNQNQSAKDWS